MDNRLPAGLRGRVIFGKGNKVTIGDRIRRIRKKRRLTQAELAMMSGLSLSAIQGYEQGRYEPKRKSLESIAEVFKIPVDELYDMPTQLSTNLASLGTNCSEFPNNSDTISRQDAVSRRRLLSDLKELITAWEKYPVMAEQIKGVEVAIGYVELIPSAQPEIIRCKDCKHYRHGLCMKASMCVNKSENGFCDWAERREVTT